MGLYLRSSSLANPGNTLTLQGTALEYDKVDGNFMYLLTNMSGSNVKITGSTGILGNTTITGNLTVTGATSTTASWANDALQALSSSYASTASYILANNVVGLSYIATGSVTASVDVGSTSFQIKSGSSTFLTVSSSGNVGIGSNDPATLLHLRTTLGPNVGSNTNFDIIRISPTQLGNIYETSYRIVFGQDTFSPTNKDTTAAIGFMRINSANSNRTAITFATYEGALTGSDRAIERMRVDPDGRVGIGTTNPSYQLQLSTDSAAKPSTNTWTIASDRRIKENIQPYTKGLNTVTQLNPVTYDYNGKAGFAKLTGSIGIIAQDVMNIIPETISTYNTKLNPDDTEDTVLYNFNSHAVTFMLINAIKELKTEIDAIKAKLK